MKKFSMRPGGIALALLCVSLGACSLGADNEAEARQFAVQACTPEAVQSKEGFEPNVVAVSELSRLADTATRRSEWAGQAAALNERWLLLSDASNAIAVFAQRLLEVRLEGDVTDESISSDMWDQYKTASNAYLAECESALKIVDES